MKQNFLFFLLLALLMSSSAAWAEKSDVVTSNTAGATVSFSSSGSYEWEWYNNKLRSTNAYVDNSTSQTTITISTSLPCEFSFDYAVSSESNFDKLTITLDGSTIVNAISGTISNTYSSTLSSGSHTLVFRYTKDGSVDNNDDRAYVSNMKFLTTATAIQSGSCGDNVNFVLTDDGTLTISGSGSMSNFSEGSSPWDSNRDKIIKVQIKDGVTSIGDWAFTDYSDLTSVTIPNSVKSIGNVTFAGCSGLTSVTIPNSVKSIGDAAFSECTSLSSVEIPNSVANIGENAFDGCSNLTSVTIPNSVVSIGYRVFADCSSLSSVEIPNSVANIGEDAFAGCSNLTSVTIPNSVVSIGDRAFADCSNLAELVCFANNLPKIGSDIFNGTKYKTGTLFVPKSALSLYYSTNQWKDWGEIMAIGCSVNGVNYTINTETLEASVSAKNAKYSGDVVILSEITFNGVTYPVKAIANAAFSGCSGLTSVTIPNSVMNIGNSAFYGCSSLTSVTIPKSVTSIGSDAFRNCSNLLEVTCYAEKVPTLPDSYVFYNIGINSTLYVPKSLVTNYESTPGWNRFSVREFIYNINNLYYYLDKETSTASLTFNDYKRYSGNIVIPSVVTYEGATYSVKDISYYAFGSPYEDCPGLTAVTIPSSVTEIKEGAFMHCSGLKSIKLPNSIKVIGDNVFDFCDGLSSIDIPNSVEVCHSFFDIPSVVFHSIPEGLGTSGNLPYKLELDDNSFISPNYSQYSNLTFKSVSYTRQMDNDWGTLVLPFSIFYVKNDSYRLFGLAEVADNTLIFGEYEVSGINIAAGTPVVVKTLVPGQLNITKNTQTDVQFYIRPTEYFSTGWKINGTFRPMNAANGNQLNPAGKNIYYMEQDKFLYAEKSINVAPFHAWYEVKNAPSAKSMNIRIRGEKTYVSSISVSASKSSAYIGEKVTFTANVLPEDAAKAVKWSSSDPSILSIDEDTGMAQVLSAGQVTVTATATDGSGVTGSKVFYCYRYGDADVRIDDICYNINEATKEATVTYCYYDDEEGEYWSPYLGSYAIPEKIKFGEMEYKVTSIGEHAFENCTDLSSVYIPNSVARIHLFAFKNCTGLTSVTIPNSVTSIDISAFRDCLNVKELIYEEGTKTALRTDITSITSVTIPNSVTSIDNYAFYYCKGLTSVTIPNSVTSIGDNAFYSCSGLTSVTIPNSVTSIGNSAFHYCSSLNSIAVEQGNTKYDSRDNCNAIIETNTNTLMVGCQNTIIPNSVTSIGSYAFSSCSGLTSIEIPNSVTSIGDDAFYKCSGLTSIEIPNSVTSIGSFAFQNCSGLTSVTLGNSVTSIGDYAFYYCSKLKELRCLASEVPTTLGYHVFTGVTLPDRVLYVPNKSVEAYKAANQWKSWPNIIGIKETLELTDGEAYTNEEEKTYDELTFTKTFSSSVVNKWNALYVPISIDIEEYLEYFDFAEIFNVAPTEDTNGDGDIDGKDANKLIVNKLKTGTTDPNKPYLIRPKQAGTYTFASADNVLYPAEEKSYSCSTMTDEYTFTGLYASQGVTGNDKYYMTINGILDFSPTKTITVKPNRWIMTVKSRNGSSSSANAKAISVNVIGEDEGTTVIEHVNAVRNADVIYNLNGVKMDSKNLPAGIYIKNGKKVIVK